MRWGKGEGRGGGDNDLVCQHDQSSAPQRVRRGEEGDDNVLVSRGQCDHIQSPAPQRVRGGREGEGGGMITTLLHAASKTTSSHPPRRHTNDLVGGFFGYFMCPEQEMGEGGRAGWASTGI